MLIGFLINNSVFDLLHQINELFKRDLLPKLIDVISNFSWVSLQRAHDCLEVIWVYDTILFLIEEVKYLTKVLHLIFGELLLSLFNKGLLILQVISAAVRGDLGAAGLEMV